MLTQEINMKILLIILFSITTTFSQIIMSPSNFTVAGGGAPEYTVGVDYVWTHTSLTNNTDFYEWFDSTANNLRIYGTDSDPYRPRNVDSGVVWQSYDNFFRQVASFPAGLFDGALTIEMVVKVIRTDSSQCFFQARNASNIAMGIGIGATGIFVGNAYDATNAEDYTHNSTATTGWHVLHYVWDGTTVTNFYVDGVVTTDAGDLNQYDMISGDNRLSMGKTSSTNFPICTGTLISHIAIFKEALNATQVANNKDSDIIQNAIPVWAR